MDKKRQEKIIVILGPTATGKSELALRLASFLDTEIISGDSMQVYRGMNIGTAKLKPNDRWLNGRYIKHHLMDIKSPDEQYSAYEFKVTAMRIINQLSQQKRVPIIVGGTGFYIDALCKGYNFYHDPLLTDSYAVKKTAIREQLKDEKTDTLYKKLQKIDPLLAKRIHPNDRYRVTRALEVYFLLENQIRELDSKEDLNAPYEVFYCGLTMPRDQLYSRIDERVDLMVSAGLVDEVRSLIDSGYGRDLNSMRGLGYRHICDYLFGEATLNESLNLLKKDTRHFAKRQMTWFRRNHLINWVDVTQTNNAKNLLEAFLTQMGMQDFLK